jgi:4-methylaminobutanoate oxidase (formaldehyde-forming)
VVLLGAPPLIISLNWVTKFCCWKKQLSHQVQLGTRQGLVGQLRSNANITQLLGYSINLYDQLEADTGLATGWKMNGGLRLACNQERWTEVKRQATTAHSFGLDMQLLSPKEAQDLWPLMDVSDVIGAAFLPTDGQASPSDITQALARGARKSGAKILENCAVTEIITKMTSWLVSKQNLVISRARN